MLAAGSIVAGFVLLLSGAQALVRGAAALARRFGISELLIGLTVVGFGTSSPEMLVSMQSALTGHSDIAVGNVVGSNIANVALVLALVALVRPIALDRADIAPDATAMSIAVLVLAGLSATGAIQWWQGAALFTGLVAFLAWSYRRELSEGTARQDWHAEEARGFRLVGRPTVALSVAIAGLAALLLGTDLLVSGATTFAEAAGISDAVIGLTLVAIGTSLPELATSIVAARSGHPDVAVGNLFGSNLFNTLSILGVTAMVASPLRISSEIANFDVPLMAITSLTAAALLMWRGRVGRVEGGLFFFGYVSYMWFLYAR